MMAVSRILDRCSLSRMGFAAGIVGGTFLEMLWQMFVLDVARLLEENLSNEMAWQAMGWYLIGSNLVCGAVFVLSFALRCRNVGMPMVYGALIPCLAAYSSVHFRDMLPLYVPMLLAMYLLIKDGVSDTDMDNDDDL